MVAPPVKMVAEEGVVRFRRVTGHLDGARES